MWDLLGWKGGNQSYPTLPLKRKKQDRCERCPEEVYLKTELLLLIRRLSSPITHPIQVSLCFLSGPSRETRGFNSHPPEPTICLSSTLDGSKQGSLLVCEFLRQETLFTHVIFDKGRRDYLKTRSSFLW